MIPTRGFWITRRPLDPLVVNPFKPSLASSSAASRCVSQATHQRPCRGVGGKWLRRRRFRLPRPGGTHAVTEAMSTAPASPSPFAGSEWFDPWRRRYACRSAASSRNSCRKNSKQHFVAASYERGEVAKGHHHGRRPRQLVTTFAPKELSVPRARLHDGTDEREWKSGALAGLQAAEPSRRGSDRPSLSRRDEHSLGCAVRWAACSPGKVRQGHGQPGVATDPLGLGGLAEARSRR